MILDEDPDWTLKFNSEHLTVVPTSDWEVVYHLYFFLFLFK